MNIGEKIRLYRVQKGFSQENLAEALHISVTAYGDIERNKTEVSVKRLFKICQVLEVDINTILSDFMPEAVSVEEIQQLKAELFLAKIEAERWKERFMRAVFNVNPPANPERSKIGFK
jgi:XRE family transcriptional regulator, regulator of sulfur utilization